MNFIMNNIKALQLAKFLLISIPLACSLYIIVLSLSKIKELCGIK
jgi:hypothetical protein